MSKAMSKVVRDILARAKTYEPAPDSHPDDCAAETAGIAEAATGIDAFVDAHRDALAWLIQCYPDDLATELLEAMRYDFWSRSFVERKK